MRYFVAVTLAAVVFLAACAQTPAGVSISADEREVCKAEGCTVWTEAELLELIRRAYKKGYDAGVKSI